MVPSQPPNAAPAFTYMGCFLDCQNLSIRQLPYSLTGNDPNMTPEVCAALAARYSFALFGTQSGGCE